MTLRGVRRSAICMVLRSGLQPTAAARPWFPKHRRARPRHRILSSILAGGIAVSATTGLERWTDPPAIAAPPPSDDVELPTRAVRNQKARPVGQTHRQDAPPTGHPAST